MTTISPAIAAKTRASMEGAREVGVGREGQGRGVGVSLLTFQKKASGSMRSMFSARLSSCFAVLALLGLLRRIVNEGVDALHLFVEIESDRVDVPFC